MNALRRDGVNPELLGMTKVASEDSVRRALLTLTGEDSAGWLKKHLKASCEALLEEPWALDVDAAVKPLYGHRQDAKTGYNPHQMMARITALVYNWWTIFMRLGIPEKHAEQMTSRPLALHGIARLTRHSNQTNVEVSSAHFKAAPVARMPCAISGFLSHVRATAEQLTSQRSWRLILSAAFQSFLRVKGLGTGRLIPGAAS